MAEPVQIVELWQPRCALRFGTSPCTAATDDGPRCYNTWGTCLDRPNYDGTGSIAWRFMRPTQSIEPLYERTDEDIKTNPIPLLVDVSQSSSRINLGSVRDGEAPLGITGSVTVRFRDAEWDDLVGDYYRDLRTVSGGTFWRKWMARNPFFANMRLTVYEGEAGQALSAMTKRLYIVENVDGPSRDGSVTVTGVDPLRLADKSRAQFPRETPMNLSGAINSSTTTIVIEASNEADISDQFGNTATDYLIIGSEIIGYTGYSGSAGVWTLSGVTRGVLGTTAASHSDDAAAQRVGRYDAMDAWDIAYDLITAHTDIPDSYVDKPAWDAEADVYLTGYTFSRTVTKPEAVDKLLGELMRDGTFFIWWDERTQTIPLKAVRPEISQVNLSDEASFVAGSVDIMREPDQRISRIFVHFNPIDPTRGDDPTNFENMRGRINADVENEDAGAEVRSKTVFSRWITTDAQAIEVTTRLLARFGDTPRYLSVRMLDGTLTIGEVVNVDTSKDVDTEGQNRVRRWQVIAAEAVRPNELTQYRLQEFIYQATRFGRWMADGADDYDATSDEDREGGNVMFWSDADGKMADGTQGYLWQ